LAAGAFDLVSGVGDGVGQVHGGPNGRVPLEGGVAERATHAVHGAGEQVAALKADDALDVGSAGAVEGGGLEVRFRSAPCAIAADRRSGTGATLVFAHHAVPTRSPGTSQL
jgi:hypothetical protein